MKQKKKQIYQWLLMLTLVLTAVLLPVKRSEAASYGLSLNDTWTSSTISTGGQVDLYTFAIPKAGTVLLDYQGWSIADSYVQVMNADQTEEFERHNVYTSSDVSPKTYSMSLALEPGTYCVKVWGYNNNYVGDYRLKGSFTPANNTEIESNNAFTSAMKLSPGVNSRITGFLSRNDRLDFYYIDIPYTQKAKITYTGMIPDSYFGLWDQDFVQIERKNVYTGSETAPKTYVYEETLTPGRYYIKIEPYGSNVGRYLIMWETEQKVTHVSGISVTGATTVRKGSTASLTASVAPSNATNKTLTWRSSNTYVASVDGNGKVTAKNPGTVTITAAAEDGSGVSGSHIVSVVSSIKVSSVSISGNKKVAAGSSFQLKASVKPTNADNKKVSWSSSNKGVASVSSSGKVTAKKAGKAVITAKAKDGSGKKASVTVIVLPKKMAAPTAVSASKKKVKVGWTKQSGASGYQVQYGKKSSFSGAKKKSAGKTASKTTLSKLSSKKTYYVRVRAYVKVGTKKYYGAWSKARSVRVK